MNFTRCVGKATTRITVCLLPWDSGQNSRSDRPDSQRSIRYITLCLLVVFGIYCTYKSNLKASCKQELPMGDRPETKINLEKSIMPQMIRKETEAMTLEEERAYYVKSVENGDDGEFDSEYYAHIDWKPDTTDLEVLVNSLEAYENRSSNEIHLNWRSAWIEDSESDNEREGIATPPSGIFFDFSRTEEQQARNKADNTTTSNAQGMTLEHQMYQLPSENKDAWFFQLLPNSKSSAGTFFSILETVSEHEDEEERADGEYLTSKKLRQDGENEEVERMSGSKNWAPWYQKWMVLRNYTSHRLEKTVDTLQEIGRFVGENGFVTASCGAGGAVWLPLGACFFGESHDHEE